jgi:predicted porin
MLDQRRLTVVLLAAGLLAGNAAIAADNGLYVGFSAGQSRPSFDSNPAVAAGFPVIYDSSSSAWDAAVGYQINKYFGVEVRYIKFGDFNAHIVVPGVGPLYTNIQINAWGGSLVGTAPLGRGFSLLGRVGENYTRETRGNCNICATQPASSSDNIWSPSFGVGVKYDFNANFSARGEVERFTKIGSNDNTFGGKVNLYTVGVTYKF